MKEDQDDEGQGAHALLFAAVREDRNARGRAGVVQWLGQDAGWTPWQRWGFENAEAIAPGGSRIEWDELQTFVEKFGWLNSDFRSALGPPCWSLHPDAVEVVVAIMGTRRLYEAERETAGGRKHAEYFHTIEALLAELRRIWARWGNACTVLVDAEGRAYVRHVDDAQAWDLWRANAVGVVWKGFPMARHPLVTVTSRDDREELDDRQ